MVEKSQIERYVFALIEDLKFESKHHFDHVISSIYFGGGTPSKFMPDCLSMLMQEIKKTFPISCNCEVSIELNPEDADKNYLIELKKLGFNRISLGVQSLDDLALKYLGRNHRKKDVISAISNIRLAGFDNLNIDLILDIAYPKNSNRSFWDVENILLYKPEHVSLYEIKSNSNVVDDQNNTCQYDDRLNRFFDLQQLLFRNDFIQYEINSYSKKNYECLQGLNNWNFGDYLGLGAGACTRMTMNDWVYVGSKPTQPKEYITRIFNDKDCHSDWLDAGDSFYLATEYLISTTRLRSGFKLSEFRKKRFANDWKMWACKIDTAMRKGLLLQEGDWIRPTPLGFRFLDDLHLSLIE